MIKKHNMIGISYMYVLQISAWITTKLQINERKENVLQLGICVWVCIYV